MHIQKSNKMVEYDVTSRLIVGGRVYLPKHSITLDEAEGQALCMRGFIKPKKVPAKIEPGKVKQEPSIPPAEIGIVTKTPDEPDPADQPHDGEPAKEHPSHGKSSRKNR